MSTLTYSDMVDVDMPAEVPADISFFIACTPPKVTAQHKGAFALKGGGVRFFTKKEQKDAERSLWAMVMPFRPAQPLSGPLEVTVVWTWPWRNADLRPSGEKKKALVDVGWLPCDKRPDVDNLVKAFLDVLTRAQFYGDDGQVASLILRKGWGDTPGIRVKLRRWNADEAREDGMI